MSTQKPILYNNLIGQKPAKPLLTIHDLFQLDFACGPMANEMIVQNRFLSDQHKMFAIHKSAQMEEPA